MNDEHPDVAEFSSSDSNQQAKLEALLLSHRDVTTLMNQTEQARVVAMSNWLFVSRRGRGSDRSLHAKARQLLRTTGSTA